ncbi:hypothetical protein RRG08_014363 [Elysia crispata]|uniref:Uncharacterized protein n=1 Tax=Elysia crispata TaxID=231223 RepID=A0AAE0XPN2_9GAST|nr:hypothetical protein RRG08_014363 [Elysia crispata]
MKDTAKIFHVFQTYRAWRKKAGRYCYIHGLLAVLATINTSPILAGAHSASRADRDLAKCRYISAATPARPAPLWCTLVLTSFYPVADRDQCFHRQP